MKNIYTLSNGKQITVSARNKGTSKALLGDTHYKYLITMKVYDISVSFTFHDSISNWRKGKTATMEMINDAIDCIISDGYAWYNSYNLNDFLNEFGYENSIKGLRVYIACKKTWFKLLQILNVDEIEELGNIVREWHDN